MHCRYYLGAFNACGFGNSCEATDDKRNYQTSYCATMLQSVSPLVEQPLHLLAAAVLAIAMLLPLRDTQVPGRLGVCSSHASCGKRRHRGRDADNKFVPILARDCLFSPVRRLESIRGLQLGEKTQRRSSSSGASFHSTRLRRKDDVETGS